MAAYEWFLYELGRLDKAMSVLVVGGGDSTAQRVLDLGFTHVVDTDERSGIRVQDIVSGFGQKSFDLVVAQDVLNVLHGSYPDAVGAMFMAARCAVLVDEDLALSLSDGQGLLANRIRDCCVHGAVNVVHSTSSRMTLLFSVGGR